MASLNEELPIATDKTVNSAKDVPSSGSSEPQTGNTKPTPNRCLTDLRLTDPRHDKTRIEQSKGGLLRESYLWIFDNADFQRWRDDPRNGLLWIKGNPDKGKTMLLCGIINELKKLKAGLVSFFFCKATDVHTNNATAVLRGLIYLLVDQQPSLIPHLEKKYDHVGKDLFEDLNAWCALSEIFADILQNPEFKDTYLIIDALDECMSELPKLLNLIVQKSSAHSHVKWIVSSRNTPIVEEKLQAVEGKVRLSLELNAGNISDAVCMFTQHKIRQLALLKNYDSKTVTTVWCHLSSKANNTFLWMALACQDLEKTPQENTNVRLNLLLPGRDTLYRWMVEQIFNSDNISLCKQILALVTITYRPITLEELIAVVEVPEDMPSDVESLREIINLCGSFLTIREDTVCFVHQSAKEFLVENLFDEIFPFGTEEVHFTIFSRSLELMSSTLQRDIYSLRTPGFPIEKVRQPDPDPLAKVHYSCVFWVDHLSESLCGLSVKHMIAFQDGGLIDMFLRKKYVFWLEALSLLRSMSEGVLSMAKLEDMIEGQENASKLADLIRDARRFILYYKWPIENCPLQVYASALVFSPTLSLVRNLFKLEEPGWILIRPSMEDNWGLCLQTLECHSQPVSSVAFSSNSTQVASASWDRTVKIWDVNTGQCLQTLEGHGDGVLSVAFLPNSKQVVSASDDRTIKIWDTVTGQCLQTIRGHTNWVNTVAFSPNSTQVASASEDRTVKIWDINTGQCLQTLEGHSDAVMSVAFSPTSKQVASASEDRTVKIWDINTGQCLQTLEGHSNAVMSVAFSPKSKQVASASEDRTVKIWDINKGQCLQTLEGHRRPVSSVAFSSDSRQVSSASEDRTVKIWDVNTGQCLQTLEGHSTYVSSVIFSPISNRVASASWDGTVKMWDTVPGQRLQTLEGHSDSILSIVFSPNSKQVVSASNDRTVKIWDAATGRCLQTLEIYSEPSSVIFSPNSRQVALVSEDRVIKIWDAATGRCLQTLEGHSQSVSSITFSPDSRRVLSVSSDRTIKIWDAASGQCLQTLRGHSNHISSAVFSPNSTQVASASGSWERTVKIWDTVTGRCLQTLEGHSYPVLSVAFAPDSKQIVSASEDGIVKIWDAVTGLCLQTLNSDSSLAYLVAFSPNSKQVASASVDEAVNIWDAATGLCLQTIKVGKPLKTMSFDRTNSYLLTNLGTIILDEQLVSNTTIREPSDQRPRYRGSGISADRVWITWNGQNMLWLPSEYRPRLQCVAVATSASTVALGCSSGQVLTLQVLAEETMLL